LIRKGIK